MTNSIALNLPRYLSDCKKTDDHSNIKILKKYFQCNDGGRFETYGDNRINEITGDDLVAVTFLSMDIGMKTRSGIPTKTAILLEERREEISQLLPAIDSKVSLENLAQDEFVEFFVGEHAPVNKLVGVLFPLFIDGTKDEHCKARSPKQKWVAVSKLISRKRPALLPIRDRKVADRLGYRKQPNDPKTYLTNWYRDWYEALTSESASEILLPLQQLQYQLKEQGNISFQPSLIRIADILVWNPCSCKS